MRGAPCAFPFIDSGYASAFVVLNRKSHVSSKYMFVAGKDVIDHHQCYSAFVAQLKERRHAYYRLTLPLVATLDL
jgi:hypothetical protein